MSVLTEVNTSSSRNAVVLVALIAWIFASASVGVLADDERYVGEFVEGIGNRSYLAMLDTAVRGWHANANLQSVGMLYSGQWDGMVEGPTWGAWWTQNSYGTSMCSFPFLDDANLAWTRHSQAWWFDNMANGSNAEYYGNQACANARDCVPFEVRDIRHKDQLV